MVVSVSLTFDNMGLAADVGRGLATEPDPGELGLTQAYPTVLALLGRHGVQCTFFIEGWNGLHHPDEVRKLVDGGHEVAVHGWVHEPWQTLDETTERELLGRGIAALCDAGAEVRGFRAPGGSRTDTTLAVLADLGLSYDASLDSGGARTSDHGVVLLPFRWEHVDWHWFGAHDPPAMPEDFRRALRDGLEAASTREEPLVVVAHARTSALDPARLEVLDELLHLVARDARFELVTMAELAARVAAGS